MAAGPRSAAEMSIKLKLRDRITRGPSSRLNALKLARVPATALLLVLELQLFLIALLITKLQLEFVQRPARCKPVGFGELFCRSAPRRDRAVLARNPDVSCGDVDFPVRNVVRKPDRTLGDDQRVGSCAPAEHPSRSAD